MIRNIHPIGHGGFSSEFHEEDASLFVFDCGYLVPTRIRKSMMQNSLPNGLIKALFISHFAAGGITGNNLC